MNDTLKKYTGDYIQRYNVEAKIIDLANHTGGLPRDVVKPAGMADEVRDQTNDMLLDYLKTVNLVTTPGKVYSYSNLGYAVLGMIIEQTTGKSFEEMAKETILDKLDMDETAVKLTDGQKMRQVLPHTAIGEPVTQREWNNAWMAAGGMISSAYDMTLYIKANLGQIGRDDDRLSKAIALAQTKYAKDGDYDRGLAWGYGNSINGNSLYSDSFVLSHSGHDTGYVAVVMFSHQAGAGVVVLINDDIMLRTEEGVQYNDLAFNLLQLLNY